MTIWVAIANPPGFPARSKQRYLLGKVPGRQNGMRPHVNSTAAWAAPQARATSRQCGRHNGNGSMADPVSQQMKPYLVRFIEDLQSGKESLDGIPLPVHVGDAGAEPANVPP